MTDTPYKHGFVYTMRNGDVFKLVTMASSRQEALAQIPPERWDVAVYPLSLNEPLGTTQLFASQAFAVIFDRWDPAEAGWVDDSYSPFDTPEEAVSVFLDYVDNRPLQFQNPRLVQILKDIPWA